MPGPVSQTHNNLDLQSLLNGKLSISGSLKERIKKDKCPGAIPLKEQRSETTWTVTLEKVCAKKIGQRLSYKRTCKGCSWLLHRTKVQS
jgi:hypothetical protein